MLLMGVEDKELKKEEIKLRRRRIVLIIIILIVIHILLNIIRVNITREELVNKSIPYLDYEEYETREPKITELCFEREFEWDYEWEEWDDSQKGYVSPNFRLINLENESGEFKVELAFFDNELYPYEMYKGKNYETVKDKLSWEAASMYSYPVIQKLGPYENTIIITYTQKKHSASIYWAYADVEPPIHEICNYTIEYINLTRNRTITKYRTEKTRKNITKSMTLWQLLIDFIRKA